MPFDALLEIDRAMDAMARPCVLMHQVPVEDDAAASHSRLGGLPALPAHYEWPEGRIQHGRTTRAIALPFLAQIDLAEVPDPSGLLPSSGTLFIFADIDGHVLWDQARPDAYRRILYVPNAAADTPLRKPPLHLVPVDDCSHAYPGDPCLSEDPVTSAQSCDSTITKTMP